MFHLNSRYEAKGATRACVCVYVRTYFVPESSRGGITRPWAFDGANSPTERQTRYRVALPGITLINLSTRSRGSSRFSSSRDRYLVRVFTKFTNSFRTDWLRGK